MVRDVDIRSKLRSKELRKFYSDGSKVVEELGVLWGDAVADIVVVNGYLHVYEIKSEVDDFSRFNNQMNLYNKVFDYCTLVIHEKHLDKFMKDYYSQIPFWGITTIKKSKDKIVSSTREKPKKNTNTDMFSVCHFLWKNEAIEIIKENGIKVKGIANLTKRELYKVMSENIEKKMLSDIIRHKLKTRQDWRAV